MFHQSGGCCGRLGAHVLPSGRVQDSGQRDVLLGEIEGCRWYIGGQQ